MSTQVPKSEVVGGGGWSGDAGLKERCTTGVSRGSVQGTQGQREHSGVDAPRGTSAFLFGLEKLCLMTLSLGEMFSEPISWTCHFLELF